jgi:hypothetical protein
MNVRGLPLIVLLLLVVPPLATGMALPAAAASRKDKPARDKEDKDKPKLSLTADPAFGFTPITVTLTGHLTGVDLHDRNFCHAAVTWVRIDPGQTERDSFKVREDPACVHPDEEISVADSFTKTFELYRPGSYLIRLEIQAKDGTRVVSVYTRVEVLRVQ